MTIYTLKQIIDKAAEISLENNGKEFSIHGMILQENKICLRILMTLSSAINQVIEDNMKNDTIAV